MNRRGVRGLLAGMLLPLLPAAHPQLPETLAGRVEIRRTEYGVPHVLADDLESAAFGLAYVQIEDYGARVVRGLLAARSELARAFGLDSVNVDVDYAPSHARARETFHLLDADTRAVYRGFAEGVNYYVGLHPDEFDYRVPRFSAHDVLARDIVRHRRNRVEAFRRRLEERGIDAVLAEPSRRSTDSRQESSASPTRVPDDAAAADAAGPFLPDPGSNAWALAPSRTRSGHAILLRNPHLGWDAGYYEAHITVPGVVNFYGDFRIGGPFGIIGGFNERLGWATTNNGPDLEEIYALRLDPGRPDHVLFDGGSIPLRREDVEITVRSADGLYTEERTSWRSHLGPVIHRAGGYAFVIKAAAEGEFRLGQQFLAMMRAGSLDEWKDAMRIQARNASNFTYADADGNVFYVWNATSPVIPHGAGGDSLAFRADRTEHVWTRIVPWDDLPQLANPPGGYLHNENDPFHFVNLEAAYKLDGFPANFPAPRLRLRSQHSLALIAGRDRLSLEDVVERKHSMRMLVADRVKPDLLAAVRSADPSAEVARAAQLLEAWDNTVARASRGGVLFETWLLGYLERVDADSAFAEPWTPDRPTETPRGLAQPELAAVVFDSAVAATEDRFGSWDVAWGDVHRVRVGDVDVPVGGCSGSYGCFRVLWFEEDEDGKRRVAGGDGWVLAVEFGPTPRAYSVLAYGQSAREDSPHHSDQAALFAENGMKPVAFTEAEIAERSTRRYKPGEETR